MIVGFVISRAVSVQLFKIKATRISGYCRRNAASKTKGTKGDMVVLEKPKEGFWKVYKHNLLILQFHSLVLIGFYEGHLYSFSA